MRTLYVCHGYYGCETGCCGMRLCLDVDGDEERVEGICYWSFSHARDGETAEEFASRTWPAALREGDVVLPGTYFECH